MKNIFVYPLLFVATSVIQLVCSPLQAQTAAPVNSRTKIVESKPVFEPSQAAITAFVGELESALTCKQTFEDLEKSFFSDAEMLDYLQQIEMPNYEHAVPVLMGFNNDLKQYLRGQYGQVKSMKLIFANPRYGINENMKIVGLGIQITMKDESLQSMRLQIAEYNGKYKLFTIDS